LVRGVCVDHYGVSYNTTCFITSGALKTHTLQVHGERLTRTLEENTAIFARGNDFLKRYLLIKTNQQMNVLTESFDILSSAVRVIRKKSEATGLAFDNDINA
jgi:hypothetical protein